MKWFGIFLSVALAASVNAAELKMTPQEITVDAGSLGSFALSYPTLLNVSNQPVYKPIEVKVDGRTATVSYGGGGQIAVSCAGGELVLKLANLPAEVTHFEMEMLIDIAFSKGGSWKCGDKAGAFPRVKPDNPHLFQGNCTAFQLANAQGQTLALRVPEYAYEQVTDNREWNWPIFSYKFIVPFDQYHLEHKLVFSEAAAASAQAVELKLQAKDIAVSAGSLGTFDLGYPELLVGDQKPALKFIEAKVAGPTAVLRYDGGGEITCTVAGGDLKLGFAHLPAEVKNFSMEMHLDIAFSKGGHWKVGTATGEFPREKPAKPHLAQQENATDFQLTDAQGLGLSVHVPEYTFQQLSDLREWNWATFDWKFFAPIGEEQTISFRSAGGAAQAKPLVDELGQSTLDDWPDKVKSLAELKADAENEKAYYAGLTPPAFDRFGGLPGSGAKLSLKRTGFFHVEQKGGKSWLVDPDGNAFFHLGICGFSPSDDYTYVKGREQSYTWLPKYQGEYNTAFRPEDHGDVFSFHLANLIRKFGQPYDHEAYVARMLERCRKWGFNSIGAFSQIPKEAHRAANFPYVTHLPLGEWEGLPRVPGVFESFDPFDEKTRARVEQNIAQQVPARANDPLCIGYFIVNEPRFDEIPKAVPALDGQHACKRRLVQMLAEKYKSPGAFNAAWDAEAQSFDALANAGLAVKTAAAHADMKAFTGLYLDAYFKLASTAFRKYDQHHLLLGARYQPDTIKDEQLCRITGKYCDVVSFNYYTLGVDKALLQNIHTWSGGKPLMLSEFYWSSPRDSGLVGGREVQSQQERGLAYRNYVEQSAALGFVVGIEWFTLVDQSATGRWFSKYSGESANTGLFSVTDRPWKPMLAEMMKTNYEIYGVLLGQRAPFAWNDPRFQPGGAAK